MNSTDISQRLPKTEEKWFDFKASVRPVSNGSNSKLTAQCGGKLVKLVLGACCWLLLRTETATLTQCLGVHPKIERIPLCGTARGPMRFEFSVSIVVPLKAPYVGMQLFAYSCSFLLTAEPFCLQLCLGAFLLTIWELFYLQFELFVYS